MIEIIRVGARTLAGIALLGHPAAKQLALGAVDTLATLFDGPDGLEFERRILEVSEQAFRGVVILFEEEGIGLPEGEREAAVFALTTAVTEADLSASSLAANGYDPVAIEGLLTDATPNTALLSPDARALLRRARVEMATMLCAVAPEIPGFEEASTREALNRLDALLRHVVEMRDEVGRIRQLAMSSETTEAAQRFEEKYRVAIATTFKYMELFGVDLARDTKRYRLTIAYVSARLSAAPGAESTLKPEEILQQHSRLLITGLPGSGKTTLLQWIALTVARGELDSGNAQSDAFVPFLVRLRSIREKGLPGIAELPAYTASAVGSSAPAGWAEAKFASGMAVLLVDGIDEIEPDERESVREWISQIRAAYPTAQIVVTSRPSAVDRKWLAEEGFSHAAVEPLGWEGIKQLIMHWHAAVTMCNGLDELSEEMRKMAGRLLSRIDQSPSLFNLARTPLLCALLCALHFERNEEIPRDRVTLYQACCTMLIDRRDKERRIAAAADFPLDTRPREYILQQFAYWLIKNGWSEVADGQVLDFLRSQLGRINVDDPPGPDELMRWMVERSGVVRRPAEGRISFIHRTFQEFLAAGAAVETGDTGVLAEKGRDPAWREVVVLAAGLGYASFRRRLITELLQRGQEGYHQHEYNLLAAACTKLAVEIPQELRSEIERRIKRLIPPTKMSEAQKLAAAGGLAVPHLANSVGARAREKACCVRALTEIGSNQAFATVLGYSNEKTVTVHRELARAFARFQNKGPEALRLARWMRRVYLSHSRGFEGCGSLGHVQSLLVDNLEGRLTALSERWASKLRDVHIRHVLTEGPLELPRVSSTELRVLHIGRTTFMRHGGPRMWFGRPSYSPLTDLSALQEMRALQSLVLAVFDAGVFAGLELPPDLRTLQLACRSGEFELKTLSGATTELTNLALLAPSFRSSSPIQVGKLKKLEIRGLTQGLSVLGSLVAHRLESLMVDVVESTEVEDLSLVPPSVQRLVLKGRFSTVGQLPRCSELRELSVDVVDSIIDDASLFEPFRGIRQLRVVARGVTDSARETLDGMGFSVQDARPSGLGDTEGGVVVRQPLFPR